MFRERSMSHPRPPTRQDRLREWLPWSLEEPQPAFAGFTRARRGNRMKRHLSLAWLILGSALMLTPFSAFLKTSSIAANSGVATRTTASSPPIASQQAPFAIFMVTNNNDSGTGSLRDAINLANSLSGADVINFVPGIGTINVGSIAAPGGLPTITEAVTIDAGSSRVELNGASAGFANGLRIFASGVIVRGLAINRFELNGISITADNCIIQNNFIGTNASGTSALPNLQDGISISGLGNLIGGTTQSDRNVISGNGGLGVQLRLIVPSNNTIQGSSSDNSIQGSFTSNNTIQGNFIGTDVTGNNPLGNSAGIGISSGANDNTIGGIVAGAGNVIAHNLGRGVQHTGGTGNAILGNSFFENGSFAIDLGDDSGVTPNDLCDDDTGANNMQNFPVLTSASTGFSSTTIVGTLGSTLGTTFRIEFFSSPNCDDSGNGEGQTFIGATTVNIPANSCEVPINSTFPVSVPVGSVITATATDSSNNTSEFSACVTV